MAAKDDITIEPCSRGYHIFRVTWDPELGEVQVLPCAREPASVIDKYTMCVAKCVYGHFC